MFDDRSPDSPLGWIVWLAGFAPYTQYCVNGGPDWSLVAANDDYGWGSVAGNVGTRGVDDMG